jgi:DNA-binding LacI/PurR family transcriptional regulator
MMTIRELAGLLGLSKSTVAYALRGSPMVNAQTREWVQARARELGYIPNPVASAFLHQVRAQRAEGYRGNMVFLTPIKVERPYLTSLQEGAHERARELGYGMDVIRVDEYNAARLTRLLLARGVLGVIIGPLGRAMGHMTLDWSKFAVATYGYSMARPAVHRVVHHHYRSIQTIFRMCRRKGFRRIGLALRNEADMRSDHQWSAGYLEKQHLLQKSERLAPFLVPTSQFTPEKIRQWVLKEKPDVVIVHTSECQAYLPAPAKGPPGSFPCVVLDRKPEDVLPGTDQQFKSCGKLLVDSLSLQIYHNERGIPQTPIVSMMEGIWVDQPSLRLNAGPR